MTPREQIDKEENLRFPPTKSIVNSMVRGVFREGAEYGYNLAIENVVNWLCKNMTETKYWCINAQQLMSKPELINNLKQAMKL